MELNRPVVVLVAVQCKIFVCKSAYKEHNFMHKFISCANTAVCTGTFRINASVLCGRAGLLFVP